MHVEMQMKYELHVTAKEFSIITKTLAGVKLSHEEREIAAALNKHMLELRVRILRESLEVSEGALKKVTEPQGPGMTAPLLSLTGQTNDT